MDRETAARLALAAALLGGVSYVASWEMDLPQAWSVAWKGTGVGFLALYAALRARSTDGWLLTAVMALGCLGDVLLNAADMTAGGAAFLAAHLTAVWLYARNRRPTPGAAASMFAAALVPAVAVASYLLPGDRAAAPGIALYGAGVALMAAMAWLSRFPRPLVGLGGLMFVVSDLLIFARIGPLAGQAWVGFGVWGLYFAGQALICVGVARALARSDAATAAPLAQPA
ncbi:lysoplasmalogenase family protein [Phenylobacterium sp.]|uniref:lysoplasmalogenase family protein n=1 Tax=Phenylobacterium sp. TaxID=1871053 RepID=UPI0035B4EC79